VRRGPPLGSRLGVPGGRRAARGVRPSRRRPRPGVRRRAAGRARHRLSRSAPGIGAGVAKPRDIRWRAMSVALVAGFMTLLDVSIVNTALPSIRNDLDLSSGELQWVLSG